MKEKNIKRGILLLVVCAMLVSISVTATAIKPVQKIYMTEKNPSDWSYIDGGWGEFIINDNSNHFVFNGHQLVPGTDYTLVAYVESWPNAVYIGEGTVNCYGDIHIMGYVSDLPTYTYTSGEYAGITGTKIWLVHSADYIAGHLAWAPSGWLWETCLLV